MWAREDASMGLIGRILWISLLIALVATACLVAAEVDWTDEVADDMGDVEDTGGTVVSFPAADILMVSITEQGNDINVSMVLAGAYNSSGMYSISVSIDGSDDVYDFSWMFIGFSVTDPSGGFVDVEGTSSADGKTLSWVIAKADVSATTSLEIEYATAIVSDFIGGGLTYMDNAGFGGGGGDGPMPGSMDVVLRFAKMNVLEMKVTMTYNGDDAKLFRQLMDENEDGTVSETEYQAFVDDMFDDEPEDPEDANVTLDGKKPTALDSDPTMEGAKGAVESTQPLKIILSMKVTFPKVEDKDTHVVAFTESPFGEDFIGGDEPWENEFDMSMKVQAPDGWKFKSGSLPAKMKGYVNDDGDEISMGTADIQKDWNATFKDLDGFTIESTGDDDSPGFGLLAVVAAVTVVVALAVRKKN